MNSRLNWLSLAFLLLFASNVEAQKLAGPFTLDDDAETAVVEINRNIPAVSVSVTGTFSGTLTFKASNTGDEDDAVTIRARDDATDVRATSTTGTGMFVIPNVGYSHIVVESSGWASGSAVITYGRGGSEGNVGVVALVDSSGNPVTPLIVATASAEVDSAVETELVVTGTAGQIIYVTGFSVSIGGATTYKWVAGTGTNCGTGQEDVTDLFNGSKSDGGGVGAILFVPTGKDLCITNTASTVKGYVSYTKF